MEDKKKKFLRPIAEVIDFTNDDIITESMTDGTDAANWEAGGGDVEDF